MTGSIPTPLPLLSPLISPLLLPRLSLLQSRPPAQRRWWRWCCRSVLAAALSVSVIGATSAFAAASLSEWQLSGYAVGIVPAPASAIIEFEGGHEWPNVFLRRVPVPGAPPSSTLVLPLENLGDQAIDLFVRIGDDAEATWPAHALSIRTLLAPHESRRLVIALTPNDPREHGMQDGPPPLGMPADPSAWLIPNPAGQVEPAAVRAIALVVWGESGSRRLRVGAPEWANWRWGDPAYRNLVDGFGQFARGEWPQKVHALEDLAPSDPSPRSDATAATDDLELSAGATPEGPAPAHPGVDRFGGTLGDPASSASGFFRVERDPQGRWWLFTPEGHRFFSIGVDAVDPQQDRTFVEGRESMFEALPEEGATTGLTGISEAASADIAERMPRFNRGRWFDFLGLNLSRRFGTHWRAAFDGEAIARLSMWGFNTLGNWSAPTLWDRHALPYTVPISVVGSFHRLPRARPEEAALPDPYDPKFAAALAAAVAAATRGRTGDPWLLGYFVDNELPWGVAHPQSDEERLSLALRVLAEPGPTPTRTALAQFLAAKYASVDALNRSWGTHLASFDELGRSFTPASSTWSGPAVADLEAFQADYVTRYYAQVAGALKRADAHHLYLGSRFAAQTDAALAACARYCDVLSFNIYGRDAGAALADRLGSRPGSSKAAFDRPVLISEFNFSSRDRGPFGRGVIDVGSEAQRAMAYQDFTRAAAQAPNVIGLHWFEYFDEPVSGRLLDGENSHFGLVGITDLPWQPFVSTVTAANRSLPSIHDKSGQPP